MFRPCGRAGRVIDEAERSPGRSWMSSSSDLKFVIFRDMKDWTYPASVDTFLSRGVLFFQSNLLELSGTQVP